jgi:hypothetical protein
VFSFINTTKKNHEEVPADLPAKCFSCGISCGFICGNGFPAELPVDIVAELPVDYPQDRLLQFHLRFWQEIPQVSFLRISKTAGNNYLQRF